MIPPHALRRGETIGIIAPAGQIHERQRLEQGITVLREMGFDVRLPDNLWPGTGYLADSDRNRALELLRMLEDPEVPVLLALRGGFGCLRMLPYLDSEVLRRNPKLVVGFSDITILHAALQQASPRISLHGPMLTTLPGCNRASLERFHASISGKWDAPIKSGQVEVLRGGDTVRGRLAGGNLSSLVSILATPVEDDWRQTILFLEDVGEPLYRLDRMLTQLAHCGKLSQPAGIILGDFSRTLSEDPIEKIRFHEEIWTRVLELTANTGMPVWGNFPVGHGADNLTLPLGADTTMDSSAALLSFP